MVKTIILVSMLLLGQVKNAPIVHDFGKTQRNQEVGHIFSIVNDSKEPLIVEGIEAG
jgi:hypothetical protein